LQQWLAEKTPHRASVDKLRLGGFAEPDKVLVDRRMAAMFERFPRLRERQDQIAGSLSGGALQMVAIARALISAPRLLFPETARQTSRRWPHRERRAHWA
jgi:ABC-type branched-subunit amino acid transport system ATPase component